MAVAARAGRGRGAQEPRPRATGGHRGGAWRCGRWTAVDGARRDRSAQLPAGVVPSTQSGPGPRQLLLNSTPMLPRLRTSARLAQLAERKALNLVVVGSSPTVGGMLSVFSALAWCVRRQSARAVAGAAGLRHMGLWSQRPEAPWSGRLTPPAPGLNERPHTGAHLGAELQDVAAHVACLCAPW